MRIPFTRRSKRRTSIRSVGATGIAVCIVALLPLSSCGGGGTATGFRVGIGDAHPLHTATPTEYTSVRAAPLTGVPGGTLRAPAYSENRWAELSIDEQAKVGRGLCFMAEQGDDSVLIQYWGPSANLTWAWQDFSPGAGGSKARFRSKARAQVIEYRFARSAAECPNIG